MSYKLVASLVIILSSNVMRAQDSLTNNILTTKQFRYGIFGNPKEFRSNTPSVTSGFRIEVDSSRFHGQQVCRWKLRYNDGKKVRRAYAFCDGLNLFINARTFDPSADYFIPIIIVGPVIYFEDYMGRQDAEFRSFGLTPVFIAHYVSKAIARDNPGWFIYLADEDGFAYTLDGKSVRSVFEEDDPELYTKFKADKRAKSNSILKEYLIEYNKREMARLAN